MDDDDEKGAARRIVIPDQMVKDTRDYTKHPLLVNRSYEQLQRNALLEMRPAVLHFGGYRIHMEHSQRLRILNISGSSLRLSIIGPMTAWFQAKYTKKGILAPGMSEDLEIIFSPTEWRYYFDSIKIYCGEESNLVVPIHAYPTANDIQVPRFIDMGAVPVGMTVSKQIPLQCTIPISFEYMITVLEDHPDFSVEPLQGMIPADDTVVITVTFRPSKFATARAELELSISQFDFEPLPITLMGSSRPDLAHDEVLRPGKMELQAVQEDRRQEMLITNLKRLQDRASNSKTKPCEVKYPDWVQPETIRVVDGVQIPIKPGKSETNFVMNQTPGKVPLKDLPSFISDQRAAAESKRLKAEGDGRASDDDDDTEDLQATELRFEMQWRSIADYDKAKEIKSVVCIGEDPPSEQQQLKTRERRSARLTKILEQELTESGKRVETEVLAQAVSVPVGFKPEDPTWNEYGNDTFAVRLQTIDRFVTAGSKVLMRVRAGRRLQSLQVALRKNAVADRQACVQWVDAENKQAKMGGQQGDDKGESSVKLVKIPINFCQPEAAPVFRPLTNSGERDALAVDPLDNFWVWKEFEPKPRLDYQVLQYVPFQPEEFPPAGQYMRPISGDGPCTTQRKQLVAALDEQTVTRGVRGDFFDGAEDALEMPSACLLCPEHDPMDLIRPSTEVRTFLAIPPFTECDAEYRLQEVPPPRTVLTSPSLVLDHVRSCATPWSNLYKTKRKIDDPFGVHDPWPASACQGGGKYGPSVAGDPAGDRFRYLPIGGMKRDMLSDTDSDGRDEEFEIDAPEFKEHMKDLSAGNAWPIPAFEGRIVSEKWTKDLYMENRLRKQVLADGRAVRERLHQWNSSITEPHMKLFLG
mmetsp:Transcript_1891/g.4263  ORF Transcript_1891/g.4263 Transcript_1891/m.4263 type:complete len:866 (+) Transcript_1891:80-2677(+)